MKIKLMIVAACLCLLSMTVKASGPQWDTEIGNLISSPSWMKQLNTGVLVIGAGNYMYGYDADQKKQTWKYTNIAGKTSEGQCVEIVGSPFAMIQLGSAVSPLADGRLLIINSVSGKEVFDSKDEKVRVSGKFPLAEIGGVLIEMVKDKRSYLMLLDYATGERKWMLEMGEGKTGAGAYLGTLKSITKSAFGSGTLKYAKADSEKNILFVNEKTVCRINAATGNMMWTKTVDKNVGLTFEDETNHSIYFGLANKPSLYCLNLTDGTENTKKPVKLGGDFISMLPYSDDQVVIMHEKGFNILNLKTNTFLWKKDSYVGQVNDIQIIKDKGFVTANVQKDEVTFTFVNINGKDGWDETVSGEFVAFNVTPKGLYYITTERCNILDLATGKDVWKKSLKLKGIPRYLVDRENNCVVMFSNEKMLSKFDLTTGDYTQLNDKIKLIDYVDKDENKSFGINGISIDFNDHNDVVEIDNVNGNYLIRSNQNFWLVNGKDGNVIYSNYYKAAGLSKGVRSLMQVGSSLAMVGAVGSVYGAMGSAMMGKSTTGQVNAVYAGAYGSEGMRALATRIAATSATKNNVYVLSKFDDGTKGLVCMDKSTGKEIQRILFSDNTPIYTVDDVLGKLYLLTGTKLSCYNLESAN